MKKLLTVGIVVLLALLLVVLLVDKLDKAPVEQDGQTTTISTPGDYFPLTKGSTWDYEGTGNEYASFTREVLFTEGDLAQITESNGGTDITRIYKTTDEAVISIFNMGESYTRENMLNQKPNENTTILMSPLVKGTKWIGKNVEREIVDTSATVETPAGVFKDCLKVTVINREQGVDSTVYEYYAKGVGMVKEEFIFSGEIAVTSSLKAYHIVSTGS
ncbi:MAG: TapB family protein [Bacillota bacterium]